MILLLTNNDQSSWEDYVHSVHSIILFSPILHYNNVTWNYYTFDSFLRVSTLGGGKEHSQFTILFSENFPRNLYVLRGFFPQVLKPVANRSCDPWTIRLKMQVPPFYKSTFWKRLSEFWVHQTQNLFKEQECMWPVSRLQEDVF